MALHFSRDESARRRSRAIAAMVEAGLDGLLMFQRWVYDSTPCASIN